MNGRTPLAAETASEPTSDAVIVETDPGRTSDAVAAETDPGLRIPLKLKFLKAKKNEF